MQAKLLAALLALTAVPAMAQSSDTVRYQLISVSGGFVRLDTVSGTITFCRDEVDSFRCSPIVTDAAKPGQQPEAGAAAGQKMPKDNLSDKRDDGSSAEIDQALSVMAQAMKSIMAMSKDKPRDCAL